MRLPSRAMQTNSLNHFKSIFVHQFFIRAADQNYSLARWARIVGLSRESFSQAHQALEKYFKAALLLNGEDVRSANHDIMGMFDRHSSLFGSLAVSRLVKSDAISDEHWDCDDARDLVWRIESNGNPNSRYRLTSFVCRSGDLFALDDFVRQIRRLSVGLNWTVGEDWPVPEELLPYQGRKFSDVLVGLPNYQVRGDPLKRENAYLDMEISVEDAIHAWNHSFPRASRDLEGPMPPSVVHWLGQFENSYLFLLWEAIRKRNADEITKAGTRWLTSHVYLPRDVKRAFEEELNRS